MAVNTCKMRARSRLITQTANRRVASSNLAPGATSSFVVRQLETVCSNDSTVASESARKPISLNIYVHFLSLHFCPCNWGTRKRGGAARRFADALAPEEGHRWESPGRWLSRFLIADHHPQSPCLVLPMTLSSPVALC